MNMNCVYMRYMTIHYYILLHVQCEELVDKIVNDCNGIEYTINNFAEIVM